MSDWKERLRGRLEPILRAADPRPEISVYHDMPFAIFVYEPEAEFALRRELDDLKVRLSQAGKRVTRISLSECLYASVAAAGVSHQELAELERSLGTGLIVDTIREAVTERAPMVELLLKRVPEDTSPEKDVVFLERAGALYPIYHTSALLERLQGRLGIPTVLFYPGAVEGPASLRFMGVQEAHPNYRPHIF